MKKLTNNTIFLIIIGVVVLILILTRKTGYEGFAKIATSADHHICVTCNNSSGSFTCSPAIVHPDGTPYCLDPNAIISTSADGCSAAAANQICKLN